MNIEQKVKELQQALESSTQTNLALCKKLNEQQEEAQRYKHLWETNVEESKEIIVELKEREKKEKRKFLNMEYGYAVDAVYDIENSQVFVESEHGSFIMKLETFEKQFSGI